MANNYSQFAEVIPQLSAEERLWCEKVLGYNIYDADTEQEQSLQEALQCTRKDVTGFDQVWPGFSYFFSENALYLYAEEYGYYDQVAAFVGALIKQFRPDYIFTLTSSDTCSCMRAGEFGGGWVVVSREGAWFGSADHECHKRVLAIQYNRASPRPTENRYVIDITVQDVTPELGEKIRAALADLGDFVQPDPVDTTLYLAGDMPLRDGEQIVEAVHRINSLIWNTANKYLPTSINIEPSIEYPPYTSDPSMYP